MVQSTNGDGDLHLVNTPFDQNTAHGKAYVSMNAVNTGTATARGYGQGGGVYHDGGYVLSLDNADFTGNQALATVSGSGEVYGNNLGGGAIASTYGRATGGGIDEGGFAPTVISITNGSQFIGNNAELLESQAQANSAYSANATPTHAPTVAACMPRTRARGPPASGTGCRD